MAHGMSERSNFRGINKYLINIRYVAAFLSLRGRQQVFIPREVF